MYDGTGIANISARTVEIGAEGGDTIEMVGWFVCNGNVSTPAMINRFIRGASVSGVESGNNDSIVVQHNHGASSGNQSVSHTHTIGNQTVSHSHTINGGGAHSSTVDGKGSAGTDYRGIDAPLNSTGVPPYQIPVTNPGNHTHTQGNQSAAHSHTPGNQSASHDHVVTVNNEGVSGVNTNMPRYFSVIYIIRMS